MGQRLRVEKDGVPAILKRLPSPFLPDNIPA
jgi:hypothetical protein